MADEYELMFEPLPGGWKYGFPRALPKEAVINEDDKLQLDPKFDIIEWVSSFGFPQDAIHKWKVWPQEVDMCGGIYEEELKEEFATEIEKMGDLKFTTAGDYMKNIESEDKYIYPGSDCQE